MCCTSALLKVLGVLILCIAHVECGNFTILGTSSLSGNWLPISDSDTQCSASEALENNRGDCYGGQARRISYIEGVRNSSSSVLVCDTGSSFFGTIFYQYFGTEMAVHSFNDIKYDFVGLGRGDFLDGTFVTAQFLEAIQGSGAHIVTTNVDFSNNADLSSEGCSSNLANSDIQAWVVEEYPAGKVGIIGIIPDDLHQTSVVESSVDINDFETRQTWELVQDALTEMKASHSDVDLVIMLNGDDRKDIIDVLDNVDGINVVLSGHHALEVETYKDTIILTSGEKGSSMMHISIVADNGVISSWSGPGSVLLDNTTVDDVDTWEYVVEKWEEVEVYYSETFGVLEVDLYGERGSVEDPNGVRRSDSGIGRLVADSILEACPSCDFSFINGGALRSSLYVADLPDGNITYDRIVNVFPFTNFLSIATMQGVDILKLFQQAAWRNTDGGAATGSFPSVSGTRYVFNPSQDIEMQDVIINIEIYNSITNLWEKLLPNKYYKFSTVSYIRGGGDGLDIMLLTKNGGKVISAIDNKGEIKPYITSYIKKNTPINYPSISEIESCYTRTIPLSQDDHCRIVANDGTPLSLIPACITSNIEYSIGECDMNGFKILNYTLKEGVECDQEEGVTVPKPILVECSAFELSNSNHSFTFTLIGSYSSFMVIMCLFLLFLVFLVAVKQYHKVFSAQILLLLLYNIGVIISITGVFLESIDISTCTEGFACLLCGQYFTLSSLIGRLYRNLEFSTGKILLTDTVAIVKRILILSSCILVYVVFWSIFDTSGSIDVSNSFELGVGITFKSCYQGFTGYTTYFVMQLFLLGIVIFYGVTCKAIEGNRVEVIALRVALLSKCIEFVTISILDSLEESYSVSSTLEKFYIICVCELISFVIVLFSSYVTIKGIGADNSKDGSESHKRIASRILSHPVSRQYFRIIVEEGVSGENLDCWERCQEYKSLWKNNTISEQDRVSMAYDLLMEIYRVYIKIGSSNEINISKSIRGILTELVDGLLTNDMTGNMSIDANVLNPVISELEYLMRSNFLGPFQKSYAAITMSQTMSWLSQFDDLNPQVQFAVLGYLESRKPSVSAEYKRVSNADTTPWMGVLAVPVPNHVPHPDEELKHNP